MSSIQKSLSICVNLWFIKQAVAVGAILGFLSILKFQAYKNMHKLVRSLILALSVALPPSALAIAPVTNSGLEHMTTCYCYQAMMATANTCGMECGRGTIAHIGHWNGIKNSFLALKFLKMSEELGGVDHGFHQAIKTQQAEQHAALDNRNIIEQSPIINLPELDTEKLTEELGKAADKMARQELEYFNSDVNKMANAVIESIKINNLQNHPQIEAYIKGLAEAAIRRHLKIDSSASDYNDYLDGIIDKVNLEL